MSICSHSTVHGAILAQSLTKFSIEMTTHHRSRPRTSIYPKFASHPRTMANRKAPGFSNLVNSAVESTSFGTHPQQENPPFITPLPPQITCSEIFLCAWPLTGATAHQSNNTVVRSASPYRRQKWMRMSSTPVPIHVKHRQRHETVAGEPPPAVFPCFPLYPESPPLSRVASF